MVRRSNVFDPFADLWADPFDTFRSIVPAISGGSSETAAFANARMDWKETPEAHVFKADLPGVTKEEVKGEVEDGNVLVVSGERTKEKEDKNDKWHRVERSSGKFVRRFRLPEDAKVEEVKVEVDDGNVLQISGERNKEQEEKTDTWHRVERSSGKFLRRFRLPENVKAEEIKAAMENGVLTVTVPKEGAKKPEVKSIQISG